MLRGAHPRLPRPRPVHRQGQQAAELHACARRWKIRARDTNRIVLPPASYLHEQEKIEQRWPAAVEFIKERKLNEFFGRRSAEVGIIVQGGMYNGVMRALQQLGLADVYGETARAALRAERHLSADRRRGRRRSAVDKKAVLMVEEGQPEFIEQALNTILRRRDIQTKICRQGRAADGRRIHRRRCWRKGVESFLEPHAPRAARQRAAARRTPPVLEPTRRSRRWPKSVPPRPPGFCTGCPERPIFAAMKLVEKELGPHHVAGRHRLPSVLDPAAVQYRRAPRWATGSARPRPPPSTSRPTSARSRSWATAASGTTA